MVYDIQFSIFCFVLFNDLEEYQYETFKISIRFKIKLLKLHTGGFMNCLHLYSHVFFSVFSNTNG